MTSATGQQVAGPEDVTAAQVEIGDVITVPGTVTERCRVRGIRRAAPGLLWFHLDTVAQARRIPYRLTLTVNQPVSRHGHAPDRLAAHEGDADDS